MCDSCEKNVCMGGEAQEKTVLMNDSDKGKITKMWENSRRNWRKLQKSGGKHSRKKSNYERFHVSFCFFDFSEIKKTGSRVIILLSVEIKKRRI